MKPVTPSFRVDNLVLRSRMMDSVRRFFTRRGYLEVDTPIRIPAPAPEVHIDAVPSGDGYLHTSPELAMKRLLCAGLPKIFQICKVFRQGERGRRHLPEFTLLEWYEANMDYLGMMEVCEDLILHVIRDNGLEEVLEYEGCKVTLAKPWERLTVKEAFSRYASLSLDKALSADRFDEIMGLEIEPLLGKEKPVFLYDYPEEKAALARIKPGPPAVGERFELYIAGLELCNAFSELIDPTEQRLRFEQDAGIRQAMGKAVYPLPEPFLKDLGRMPEAAGNALGLDRLVMLLAGAQSIDEVVTFTPEAL